MNRRQLFVAAAAFAAMLGAAAGAEAAAPMKVSASFSILGDMVKEVGGDRVEVFTFVGPNGDAHVYEPTPADAKELSESKILFINGLGLEGWMTRLENFVGLQGNSGHREQRRRPARDGRGREDHHRSACLAEPRQRQDLCRQYPRRAHRRRS